MIEASPAAPEPGRRRFFFALWPDPGVRRELLAYRDRLAIPGRQPVYPEDLHLTLLFLGACGEPTRRRLLAPAAELCWEPFTLILDRCGCWATGGRVFWLAPRKIPGPLLELVRELRALARRQGLEPEARDYRPHLTLFRGARPGRRPAPQQAPHWQVREFVLAESLPPGTVPRYRALGRWPGPRRAPRC